VSQIGVEKESEDSIAENEGLIKNGKVQIQSENKSRQTDYQV